MSTKDPIREEERSAEHRVERAVRRVEEKLIRVERSLMARVGRGMMWTILSVILLIALLVGAFMWYSTTPDFERRVARQVVNVLENATGGRVELRTMHFNLWHLAIEVDGLVIHGLEGPGEAPYHHGKSLPQ